MSTEHEALKATLRERIEAAAKAYMATQQQPARKIRRRKAQMEFDFLKRNEINARGGRLHS
jgi:hypothetical protein